METVLLIFTFSFLQKGSKHLRKTRVPYNEILFHPSKTKVITLIHTHTHKRVCIAAVNHFCVCVGWRRGGHRRCNPRCCFMLMAEWESTFFKTEIRTQMESLNQHHLGRHWVHDAAALPLQIAIDNRKAGGF